MEQLSKYCIKNEMHCWYGWQGKITRFWCQHCVDSLGQPYSH